MKKRIILLVIAGMILTPGKGWVQATSSTSHSTTVTSTVIVQTGEKKQRWGWEGGMPSAQPMISVLQYETGLSDEAIHALIKLRDIASEARLYDWKWSGSLNPSPAKKARFRELEKLRLMEVEKVRPLVIGHEQALDESLTEYYWTSVILYELATPVEMTLKKIGQGDPKFFHSQLIIKRLLSLEPTEQLKELKKKITLERTHLRNLCSSSQETDWDKPKVQQVTQELMEDIKAYKDLKEKEKKVK